MIHEARAGEKSEPRGSAQRRRDDVRPLAGCQVRRVALRTYQIARPEARLGSPAKVAEPADAPALGAVPVTRYFSLTC